MAEYTPNYNLYKPNRADSDFVDTTLSANFVTIDTEIKNRATDIAKLTTDLEMKTTDLQEQLDSEALSVQEQINTLVVNGDSSPAIEQALAGTPYTTLREKLLSLDEEIAEQALDSEQRGINVMSFGADPSLEDNSLAFADALNHIKNMLSGKGKLILPAGKTFKFTKVIGDFNLSNVDIDLNGCTLDFSAIPADQVARTYLGFKGTYGQATSLVSNCLIGSKTINVDTTWFAAGDMVRVYSNKIYDSTRTTSRIGEIFFIDKIDSASQLTLKSPVNFDYFTADFASIQKLNPVHNIHIHNGSILGTEGFNQHYAIEITVGWNCLINNLNIQKVDKRQIVLTDCVFVNVDKCSFKRASHTSQAYGVSYVDGTCDCVCSNSYFEGVRHSLSTNNNFSSSWGLPRRILFKDNTVVNSSRNLTDGAGGDAIDTHAGAEEIFIINNTVSGSSGHGINFEARSGIIANNVIRDTETIGIYVNPRSDFKSKILVTGNKLERIGKASGSNYGICVALTTAGCVSCVIANNDSESQHQAIRAVGTAAFLFEKLVIQGNTGFVTVSSYGIHADYVRNGSISGNSVKAPDVGVYCGENENTSITGNSIILFGTGANAWGVRLNGSTKYSNVSNNTIREAGSGRTTAFGVVFQTSVTYSGAFNNVTQGFITNVNIGTGTGNLAANNI